MSLITRDEFELEYARRSGISVEKLHELGLFAIPCECEDEPPCSDGGWHWQMSSANREPPPWREVEHRAWAEIMEAS